MSKARLDLELKHKLVAAAVRPVLEKVVKFSLGLRFLHLTMTTSTTMVHCAWMMWGTCKSEWVRGINWCISLLPIKFYAVTKCV